MFYAQPVGSLIGVLAYVYCLYLAALAFYFGLYLLAASQTRMAQRLQAVNQLPREGAATQAEHGRAETQLAVAQSGELLAQADAFGTQTALLRVSLEQQRQPQIQPALQAQSIVSDILAPIGGRVIHTFALSQEWVAAGSDLVQLQRLDEPEIRVFVSPADAQNARMGERAELRCLDGAKMTATVVRIGA